MGDLQAPQQACEQLEAVRAAMRPGTMLVLCCTRADKLCHKEPSGMATAAALRKVAARAGAEFGLCSATTGEGIESLFCAALAGCEEAGRLPPREMPILSHRAGSLSNTELLRALLHRR